jgi:nitroreductase
VSPADPADLFSLVRAQRAHRAFLDRPVSDELVARLLEAATYAPSAENRQPWEFVVVRDERLRARIGDLTRRLWETHARDFARDRLSPSLFADVDRGADGGVSQAPVLVVVGADTARGLPATIPSSIFPAVQNLLLAARAAGLGAALITLPLWSRFLARRALGLPFGIAPCAVIPLGWPKGRYGPTTRRPVGEVVSLDRYGNRAFKQR